MTVLELGTTLRNMYETNGENKTTMIHLFGVIYADEIRKANTNATAVIKAAGMRPSYATEIQKGINLSKFLKLKPVYEGRF